MSTQALTRSNYDNCQILSSTGELMFLCQERKLRWYVERELAVVVDENPLTAKLLFDPKGKGRYGDTFFLTARKNYCVVCKSTEDLTRHHVLPYCYTRFFPSEAKIQSSYDIVLLCIEHHTNYEVHAFKLKQELARKHEVPLHGIGPTINYNAYKAGGLQNALTKHRHKIPKQRQQELLERLCFYLGRTVTLEEIDDLPRTNWRIKPIIKYGQAILEHYKDLDEFAVLWRKHFIEIMNPKFMPKYWDIDRKIYSERK